MTTIFPGELRLRPLRLEDAERIENLAGDYEIAKSTLSIPHPYLEGSAVSFIKSVWESEKKGNLVLFALTLSGEEELIGIANLNISKPHNRGELAYWVGKEYWGKGYATEASSRLLTYGFETLGLNRIFAASFADNPGSWKVMEKLGMKKEGILPKHVRKFDQYVDIIYYGLLKVEYELERTDNIEEIQSRIGSKKLE